jgi:non-heme chloroperoxidase
MRPVDAATHAQAALRRSVTVSTDGVKLAVTEAGDPAAPAILFLHGFAQSSLSFGRQFGSELARRFHLVAFDYRGHGASDKPSDPAAYLGSQVWADDIAAVIAATRLHRPVLLAWSLGGYVAMDYVRHYGTDAIAGINMVASTGGLVDSFIMAAASAASEGPGVSADLSEFIRAAADTAESYATSQTAEERRTLFATELMMPAFVRQAMAARDNRHYDLLDAIGVPILFSNGTEDPLVPPDDMAKIRAALPAATHSTYDGAGHFPFVDDTARFNRELSAFVDRVQPR